MEELVKFIIKHLVEDPETIAIQAQGDTVTVTVPKKDIGKIIGKQGRIAKSIRTILKAASKDDKRITLDIIEAE